MRIALHSTIVAGSIDAYRIGHATIPADLRALFGTAGIHDWTIWRSGHHLFHLVECDDFARAMSIVENHPANESWPADIGRFVDGFFGPDGEPGFAPIEQVWALTQE